jgi:small-conductance mechanosensitive channel
VFWLFSWLEIRLEALEDHLIMPKDKLFGFFKDVSVETEKKALGYLLIFLKYATLVVVLFFYLPISFRFSPETKYIADGIYRFLFDPLTDALMAIIGYIPNLFSIFAIVFITYFLVRFLKYMSEELHFGRINFKGFYKDWARPTYNIIRILIFSFSFIFIFPLLPGADSEAFKGISLFLGALITLGSSTAIANIVAGIVITYMRPFVIGDRVRIGETQGDITEKTLLVTKIRTIRNESITIPNAQILNGHLMNYSRYAKDRGLVLRTSVTIGYDVSWKKVHELLISAALATEMIEESPKPFVFQKSLEDNYVHYQLHAVTKSANSQEKIYSDLHANILDQFNEAQIEILSPHYRAMRDGNVLTIPAENIPEGYEQPGFLVEQKPPPKAP